MVGVISISEIVGLVALLIILIYAYKIQQFSLTRIFNIIKEGHLFVVLPFFWRIMAMIFFLIAVIALEQGRFGQAIMFSIASFNTFRHLCREDDEVQELLNNFLPDDSDLDEAMSDDSDFLDDDTDYFANDYPSGDDDEEDDDDHDSDIYYTDMPKTFFI